MLKVYTYNAGKGDCIRIQFDDHNILVDTGVIRFASRLQSIISDMPSLDLLILTHVDDDHIGGILSLLRCGWRCPFREVRMNVSGAEIKSNVPLSSRQNDEVYTRLREQGIKISPMLAGDVIEIGDATIRTISPVTITNHQTRADTPLAYHRDYGFPLGTLAELPIRNTDRSINNKNSIVFSFEYCDRRLLFTGDAWSEDIVNGLGTENQHFDLVKLPHHGSVGNISEDLRSRIDCSNFLICTDGIMHPDKQTVAKLIKWYGTVNIYSPSDWWSKGFFVKDDDTNSVNLIQREDIVIQ